MPLFACRIAFATAALLEAGKTYLQATVNASGTSNTVNRVGSISRGGSSGCDLNAPGDTAWGTPQLDSIGVGVGQAPAVFGTGKFLIAAEGMIVRSGSFRSSELAALVTSQPASVRERKNRLFPAASFPVVSASHTSACRTSACRRLHAIYFGS